MNTAPIANIQAKTHVAVCGAVKEANAHEMGSNRNYLRQARAAIKAAKTDWCAARC